MPGALESPFDPLARLEPGEDRFVIREKDPAGPAGITGWSAARRLWAIRTYGLDATGEAKRLLEAELAQCAEAEEKALAWGERHSGDAAEEQRATYSGAAMTEEQVLAAKRQKLFASLVTHLREADFYIHELIELHGPAATAELALQAAELHNLADAIDYGAGRAKAA